MRSCVLLPSARLPHRHPISRSVWWAVAVTFTACAQQPPTPDAAVTPLIDAGPLPSPVVLELRPTSAGPGGDGGYALGSEVAYTRFRLFVDGDETRVIEGVSDGGRVEFADVPGTDNVIELRSQHPRLADVERVTRFETHRREIHVAAPLWSRADVRNTPSISLRFNFTGLSPWERGADGFAAYSSGAGLSREWEPDYLADGAPENDDTAVTMELSTAAMQSLELRSGTPVLEAARGDTLTLVQFRSPPSAQLDGGISEAWDPWAWVRPLRSVAVAQVAAPDFSAEQPISLDAVFTPLEVTPMTVDLRSDTFAAASEELMMPASVLMQSINTVTFAPGSGGRLYRAPRSRIWGHLSRASQPIPENPRCYPDLTGWCDPRECAGDCNRTVTSNYRAPDNALLPLAMTHPHTEPGTELLITQWWIWTMVDTPEFGRVGVYTLHQTEQPVPDEETIVVERQLGAPRELTIDGALYAPNDTTPRIVDTEAHTVAWLPPSLGVPSHYEVTVVEYAAARTLLGVFTERTTRTQVRVPRGELQPGQLYVVRVVAVEDPNDPDDARTASARVMHRRAEATTGLFRVE